jgi:MFS family permease
VRSLRRVLGGTFGSLAIRNYRLYFASMLVSMTGSWMQRLGQSWLVLHLTGSGLDLGVVNALQFLPTLLFGAWGGVVADRSDKRRLILLTQSLMGALAAVLGALTLAGAVRLWTVDLLALLLGMVTAVDTPARQAFVPELVDRAHVSNAVSLNSAVFTSSRIFGPAAAGIVITLAGMGWCFLLNALSFAAVLGALVAMDPRGLQRRPDVDRRPGQLVEGLRYVRSHPGLRLPLFLLAMTGTFALNWSVTLPLLARDTFHGDASTYGVLFSVLGLGSLAGALFTAGRRRPSDRLLLTALAAFGVLMLGAALAPDLRVEIGVLIPLGVAAIAFQTTANSLLQLRSDPALRGRVMAIYSVVFLGTTPIGAPLVGWVAQLLGARAGVALGGFAILAALLVTLPAWRGAGGGRRWGRPAPAVEPDPSDP